MPLAPSTYYLHATRQDDPAKAPARVQWDERLCTDIQRMWVANRWVYGVRKICRQLQRELATVTRCTATWSMRRLGLRGVIRGKGMKTTVRDNVMPVGQGEPAVPG